MNEIWIEISYFSLHFRFQHESVKNDDKNLKSVKKTSAIPIFASLNEDNPKGIKGRSGAMV
jgi:hypothetical protein